MPHSAVSRVESARRTDKTEMTRMGMAIRLDPLMKYRMKMCWSGRGFGTAGAARSDAPGFPKTAGVRIPAKRGFVPSGN